MTLAQLAAMKAWHVAHKATQPLEFHTWDGVLTIWLMGWTGAPATALLNEPWAVLLCVLLLFVPQAYLALRRRLHLAGRLRCDWLTVAEPGNSRTRRGH